MKITPGDPKNRAFLGSSQPCCFERKLDSQRGNSLDEKLNYTFLSRLGIKAELNSFMVFIFPLFYCMCNTATKLIKMNYLSQIIHACHSTESSPSLLEGSVLHHICNQGKFNYSSH
jgi:hypothetical protein